MNIFLPWCRSVEATLDSSKPKANFTRLCQLLVNKGCEALRNVLHEVHPPSTLVTVLNTHKPVLMKLRCSVITPPQWKRLFPASGTPDSNNFDITLLTILLRNICGLPSPLPPAGRNFMPVPEDISKSADILRIKVLRNKVYGYRASAHLDDTTFEKLWKEISQHLAKLGIPQQDIDEVKMAPFSHEEEFYSEKLKEWKELDDIFTKLNGVEREVNNDRAGLSKLQTTVKNFIPTQAEKLAKFNFRGTIQELCSKFHPGTWKWFFDMLSSWFNDEQSTVMILTAGPGVGKSVLSARICELYKPHGKLAAYHFCDFKNSDSTDPHEILQFLASQMCDNVKGFRNRLIEVLRREHCRVSLSDAFRVLLKEPLHALDRREPVLIVVDALDEIKNEKKSEFLDLISEELPELPEWIKILITSRPEVQVKKKLKHFNPLEILPNDHFHNLDIKHLIVHFLPNLDENHVSSLISKCEGSFLYAYYLVNRIKGLHSGSFNSEPCTASNPSECLVTSQNLNEKVINKHIEHSRNQKRVLCENKSKEKGLQSSKSFHSVESAAASRLKKLENEIRSLKKQNESLQSKHEEILAELGEVTVKISAKENQERKSELFEQIFGSQIAAARPSVVSAFPVNDDGKSFRVNGSQHGIRIENQNTYGNTDALPSDSIPGATPLMQRSNHQQEIPEFRTNENGEQKLLTFKSHNEHQTTTNGTSGQETNNGEGMNLNQSGKVLATSVFATTSRQGYEDLSLSVQQDSSEAEYISLSNISPTSVATTLYNNYKLLLLFMAQRLLSSDVIKLKGWAEQNFSITDPENATDILFQLDQKGFINASDLSQIRNFFESITRFDLVHIIDEFLLGNYCLLRQYPTKRRHGNRPQNRSRNTTTEYPNISNSKNTCRYSLVGSTSRNQESSNIFQQSPQQSFQNFASTTHVSSSSNENHLAALVQQNNNPVSNGRLPPKMAEVAVANTPVASKSFLKRSK